MQEFEELMKVIEGGDLAKVFECSVVDLISKMCHGVSFSGSLRTSP